MRRVSQGKPKASFYPDALVEGAFVEGALATVLVSVMGCEQKDG